MQNIELTKSAWRRKYLTLPKPTTESVAKGSSSMFASESQIPIVATRWTIRENQRCAERPTVGSNQLLRVRTDTARYRTKELFSSDRDT